MKHIFIFFFTTCTFSTAMGQQFIDDATMKLGDISVDKKYGFKPKAKYSIKVGTIANEYKFINALTGPNGERVYARRLGSCCAFRIPTAIFGKGLLDKWEITYEGSSKSIIIYLNGYEYDEPKCPMGLNFKKETNPS
jgi:hypothetical protein